MLKKHPVHFIGPAAGIRENEDRHSPMLTLILSYDLIYHSNLFVS